MTDADFWSREDRQGATALEAAWSTFAEECDRLERETQHRENMRRDRACMDKAIANYLREAFDRSINGFLQEAYE